MANRYFLSSGRGAIQICKIGRPKAVWRGVASMPPRDATNESSAPEPTSSLLPHKRIAQRGQQGQAHGAREPPWELLRALPGIRVACGRTAAVPCLLLLSSPRRPGSFARVAVPAPTSKLVSCRPIVLKCG